MSPESMGGQSDRARSPLARRVADFKVLLPAGRDVTALVCGSPAGEATAVLAAQFGRMERLETGTAPRAIPRSESFDAVIADGDGPWERVRPGGVLLRTYAGTPPPVAPGFDLVGRWRAWPEWPAFRMLVPAAIDAAALKPLQGLAHLAARYAAPLEAEGRAGLQLERRAGQSRPVLLEELLEELACPHPLREAVVYTGRVGEGNPILVFLMGADGPQDVVKVARDANRLHLPQESERIESVVRTLGPLLAHEVIAPHGEAIRHGHAALVYRFVASEPTQGPLWRLSGRKLLLARATAWLACVARQTAHRLPPAEFETRHLAPLRRLLARDVLPPRLAARAEEALAQLASLSSAPVTVLEHGDFGIYNLRVRDAEGHFGVLDWGSSEPHGVAGADLCYLLANAAVPPRVAARLVGSYLRIVGLSPRRLLALWFAYIARRWEGLDRVRGTEAGDRWPGGSILLPSTERVADFAEALA